MNNLNIYFYVVFALNDYCSQKDFEKLRLFGEMINQILARVKNKRRNKSTSKTLIGKFNKVSKKGLLCNILSFTGSANEFW